MPIISAIEKLRQEDPGFETRLGYTIRAFLREKRRKKHRRLYSSAYSSTRLLGSSYFIL
jgi:hypothetical protein